MTSNEPPVGTVVHDRIGWAWERHDDGWHGLSPLNRSDIRTDDLCVAWWLLIVRYGPITQGMQP